MAELTADQVEALFCLAVIPEGPDVVQRVTSRFIEYRDDPSPDVLDWLGMRAQVEPADAPSGHSSVLTGTAMVKRNGMFVPVVAGGSTPSARCGGGGQ